MCGRPTIAEAPVATGLLALLDDITSILDDVSAIDVGYPEREGVGYPETR